MFSVPVFGSKCAPVQHLINILCAVCLGPSYGIAVAFASSLLRNLFGIGTLMAFPGSMFGALISALAYKYTRKISYAVFGEVFGTGILGGLSAYPIAVWFMGTNAAETAFYVYIIPFLISTIGGAVLAVALLAALKKTGVFSKFFGIK